MDNSIYGKFFRIIYNLYQQIKSCVILNDSVSAFFTSRCGLRQGENLSPVLFFIFLNDLETHLQSNGNSGIEMECCTDDLYFFTKLVVLLYADDTVLLADSPGNLQKCLDDFVQYCNNWKLKINYEKTKIVIFGTRKLDKYAFYMDGNVIEIVNNYRYLGVLLSNNGSFLNARKSIHDKANKAMHLLYMRINNLDLPIDLQLKLFDSTILPIMTYGCEIRGYENLQMFERIHNSFLRSITKSRNSTPLYMLYGELGRYPIEIFIKTRTNAASEILGKERRRKKPWVTKDVLDLCDERRDLKKKRYEAEGAKEYREANRRIQKAVKKAKEDWIGAQCEEIETCLNKNNSKRAYQLVKDLTSEKQGRSSTIQDKSGKCLTEEKEILSRWTEYCSELYNYESCGDNTVLDCSQPPEEDLQPILREEVEIAVASLKKGKSAGVDNISAELVQAGGETMIDVLTEICNRIWRTGEWPTPWTQSLIITLPKKGNLQLCQNYRTISLISHSSKVMLKVILNRLKPQAEEIIAEEQAGFRAGRSTTEQIFNLRILCEKYLQHQQNLYHVFIDFKKAFDRVWHAALWATMRKYNISANLVRTIEQLYDKATSAVQMNGSIGEWFRTTVGVRQGCLLSPTLFNIFLERIMSDALEEHDGKVSIGGRNITNLRFADDIDALAEEEQELEALVESLDKTCTRYKMEISAEKTKLMTNSANGIQREIKVTGQKLGTVTSFKYLGAVVSDDGSKPEVLSRIAQATAALTKLKPIWRDNNISLGSKVQLMRSLVISIFLYACESWTLTAELEKRTQAFEMRCYRRLLNISYKDHVTNEEVRRKIQAAIGEYDELLTLVKKRKLRWFGHVSRSSGLAKTILQGTVKGKRKRGRQKKRWEDNIKEWTGMDFASSTRAAENRSRWKGVVANSSVVPRRPSKVMG